MLRRTFLRTTAFAGAALASHGSGAKSSPAIEQVHGEIWRRFVGPRDIFLDFVSPEGQTTLPTPEECREGKPNALGWYQPIENGAMFGGLYMDGIVSRWEATQAEADAAKARRLAAGLIYLNQVSEVKGFVARGISTDGRSHYPMGSNDQTMPWFTGLWRYCQSGIPTREERERIIAAMVETAEVIISLGWRMPAEAPFGTRGSFAGYTFDTAPRLLFVLKALHDLTGEEKWDRLYRQALDERGGAEKRSRRELCEHGMVYEYAKTHAWTSCTSVYGIRGLWEMEKDPDLKAAYARGLAASARLASECLPLYRQFDPADSSVFDLDWRTPMLPLWKPQATEQEAQTLATEQHRASAKLSPRRGKEAAFIREPTSAAWIVTLCPDAAIVRSYAPEIRSMISHFDYRRLYYPSFFWLEAAWWRLLRIG